MKHFVLCALITISAITSYSQITYQTAQSGNYSDNTTWVGGASGKPLATMNNPTPCNCKIVVAAGHTLTANSNLSLTNVVIILEGAASRLTFGNNVSITLSGNASIDLQVGTSTITRGHPNNSIFINGTQIYNSDFEFQSTTNGTVQGPASASSARASGPQFQSGVLPVKLSEFTAVAKGSSVAMTWKTSLEVNSSHFVIERTTDNKLWNPIGTVQAAGNVSVEQRYAFTDAAPANGTNSYRLRIVDIDGRIEYSPIKSISFTSTSLNVVAGPNPASSFLNVGVTAQGNDPYRVRLINRAGQVVFDQKYGASTSRLQLNVSNYADGSYFLEITNNSNLRQINKIMIVRK